MSDRDELSALRRMAELEAKAGGESAPAPALRKKVEPDPRWDPTSEMSGGQKFIAATGKELHRLHMGGKQLLNIGNQEELQAQIDEHKKLDEPLNRTLAGKAGSMFGSALPLLLAAPIPGVNTIAGGAALGGMSGAMQPTASDENAATQIAGGALMGGATSAVFNAIPALAKGVVAPFFEKGQKGVAADALKRFGGGQLPPIQQAKTPGWHPTLSEATGNSGISALERGAASKAPELARALQERQLSQNLAASNALGGIAGSPNEQAMAKALRDYMSAGHYERAAQEGLKGPNAEMRGQITKFLERPSMQKAVSKAKEIFGEEALDFSESGSVKGLQLVKQSLDDMIGKAASPSSSIGKNELRALQGTRSDLIDMIQTLSPTQRLADTNYATFSRPINEQKIGQYLADKLQPALTDFQPGAPSRLTPQAYAAALRDKDGLAKKATGYAAARFDDIMSQGSKDTLQGVGEDLARRSAAQEAARGVGSNTAQNLASQQLLSRIAGPIGMPQSWAEGMAGSTIGQSIMRPAQWAAQIPEQRIQEQLAKALLDPAYAQQLLASGSPLVQNAEIRKLLLNAPTAAGIGAMQGMQQ